ncbi:NAD-dependent epimerase/dehydratase family protein [Amycolatopsis nigrescens]|uniref:NAD-dependent epimerase/dehydratase family protein n=1 Tax=Amycolatopsis nigrescens TaxID=381445 RepID=UPI00035C7D86|nr:NAD-dependent epimerase/dehydratase family protein [Amycolatopsis nigrescens]
MDALVTGGSGFVGLRLIRRLVEDGHVVRALARSDAAADKVTEAGAKPVPGDLSDFAILAEAMSGSDVVFHSAARTSRGGGRDAFERDNVTGTRNVVAGARRAGVRRLVHVGTEAALMTGQALVDVDEAAPLRPDSPAPYAASKAKAEQVVLAANGEDLETVVLRPRLVWGTGDSTVLPELVAAVQTGRFAWIGGGRHLTATTHVDNVVLGVLLAAERGRPGEAYFVTDGEPIVFRDFVTELLATQGVTAPGRSMPELPARIATSAGETLWRRLGLSGAPPLDYMSLWLSSKECTIDIGKARTELGYQPIRTRAEGFAELRA